jgi:hypothetical protein
MKMNNYYRQFFSEVQDDIHHPKTPAMGLKALIEYAKEYAHEKFVPLYTEVSGSVSLTDKHTLTFKIDSILSTVDGIKSREHKTGSQLSRQWQDQWALKMQTGVYNHVLYCLFPRDEVWGVEINGIIFGKKNIQFVRVPARRTIESMEAWLYDTIYWCDDIVRDYERLSECSDSDAVLHCFKRNTESCTKYFGCAFHDYCLAWANPLQHCEEPPYGMKVEYWNPKADQKDAKYIFTIKDGMSEVVENKKEVVTSECPNPT